MTSIPGWMARAALACAALVVGCSESSTPQLPVQGDAPAAQVIKIGAVLPLTGPNASFGNEMANAARLAVEDWQASGRLSGHTVEFVVEDDASDPKQAVSAAQRLVSDPAVVGVVAHYNSGCFLPASSVYHQAGVMAITPAATNPAITEQGFAEIGRVTSHDGVQGKAAGQFIQKRGWRKVAIVHDKTQYGQGLAEVVQKTVEGMGLEVVSFDGLTVGEKDFKTLLTKVKALSPDVLYFGGLTEEASFLVRQMKELGMATPFVSDDGVYGKDFLDAAGPAAEGALVSFPSKPFEELKNSDRFFNAYKTRFGKPVENWGPYGYDAASLLVHGAYQALQNPAEGELRKRVVENIRTGTFTGVLGPLQLDAKGDPISQSFSFYEVRGGQFVYVETLSAAEGGAAPAQPAAAEAAPAPAAAPPAAEVK